MRLFIALNIPKKQRERIHRAARELRDAELPVRWIGLDGYHVTLKFLGEVRRDQLPVVEETIERVASSTRVFDTELAGFGAFPTVRRPRVIWLGVGASPELRCLKQDLEWALGQQGFEAETRSFHPHVTLGRVHGRGGAGDFRDLDRLMAGVAFEAGLRVRAVDLMRSHLSKKGASYSVVASKRLATA